MAKGKVLIPYLAIALLLPFPSLAWAWSGMVVGVTDGDTITVMQAHKEVKVRLYGFDCPEKSQPFTKKAKQFTSKIVFGKIVEVHDMDTDRYGRTVALVAVDRQLLYEELVKAGYASVYDYYCHDQICESWKSSQLKARLDKRGLWVDPAPVPPWEFRMKKRK